MRGEKYKKPKKEIRQNIEIISRNAKLSGRKTIQKEDISELTK